MYKRLSGVLFPIVVLALIGAVVWGFQENKEKTAILIKAENQYQRAFHDLSYHVDKLNTELSNTLAVNSSSQDFYKKGLVNVWRLTSQAQNEINQLPLTLMPFSHTQQFLNNISQFSYRTAVRDLSAKPVTKDELSTLNTLFERSKEIRNELMSVQTKILSHNLRWMDVETAIASQKNNQDNQIVDGFRMVDKKVSEYPEVNWGPSMATVFQKRNVKMLSGNDLSPDEIKQKAAQFLGIQDTSGMRVVENGAGSEYNTYSVTLVKPGMNAEVQMDFAKKGGQLIYYMSPRTVGAKIMDGRGARQAAAEFLDQHGYKQMRAVSYDEYGNEANIVYAPTKDNVIIYPEKINVKVALSDGEITGFQAADYVYEHKERSWKAPTLTLEQAKKELSPNFVFQSHALAIIKNDVDEEVLCYQLSGKLNDTQYKIYINANTGFEENIETGKPGQQA